MRRSLKAAALALALAALALAALAAGCTALFRPETANGGAQGASLAVRPVLRSGAGYRTQALVTPLSSASVEHVVVKLFTVTGDPATESAVLVGGTPVERDVARADLGGDVVFENLRRNTTYRVRGYAYRIAGTAAADLISIGEASKVDVTVLGDDRPAVATLPIQLEDVDFAGEASNSLAIADGKLYATGSERVGFIVTVSTFAGLKGTSGSDDGTGDAARFYTPEGMAIDASGTIYVADRHNHAIRKVSPEGTVTTLAGLKGTSGYADGTGEEARFFNPAGVAVDATGDVYVADYSNNVVRKITPGGVVTTLAGKRGFTGGADGTGSAARFLTPNGIAVDPSGNLYVADYNADTIRKVTPAGVVTTLAGKNLVSGQDDGTGEGARFNTPTSVAVDQAGNVYVADSNNYAIRKITPEGSVTTFAGKKGTSDRVDGTGEAARFSSPQGVALDAAGNVYVADSGYMGIRHVTPEGAVTTLAGIFSGDADGVGETARFKTPRGIVVDARGHIYVADTFNSAIRKVVP